MSKATVTIEGFVSKDPETKDANGRRVVEVTVPHTPRRLNKQSNQWEDAGETQWWVASFWDAAGDAILRDVRKGSLVTVTGQPSPRAYAKNDGSAAVSLEIRFATLGVIPRSESNSAGAGGSGGQRASVDEPWSTPVANVGADAWSAPGAYSDDSPF